MRILFFTQYFPPEIGAAQTRLQSMVEELRELGHAVEVVTAFPNYPAGRIAPEYRGSFYRREIKDDVVIHRVWLFAATGTGTLRILNYLSFMLTSLWALFRAQTPDYLFVESPPPMLALPAFLFSKFRRVPFILNIADLWVDTALDFGLFKRGWLASLLFRLEKWSFDRATYVSAVTRGIYDVLLRDKGVLADKLLYLPNGVNSRLFKPQLPDTALQARLGLSGKKIVLYAGTLGPAHGLRSVLEAARLLENHPEVRFVFLGNGSVRPELERMRNNLRLTNVSFLDPVPVQELAAYYSIAMTALVSLRDIPIFATARPSKVFPALGCGKPILFAGSGEMAGVLQSANAGIVIPSENPRALADTVLRLVNEDELATQMGANGRRFVEEHYQWSTLVAGWVATLARKTEATLEV